MSPHQTDMDRARKFAVTWTVRDSDGQIANLARAYMRTSAALKRQTEIVTGAKERLEKLAAFVTEWSLTGPLPDTITAELQAIRQLLGGAS